MVPRFPVPRFQLNVCIECVTAAGYIVAELDYVSSNPLHHTQGRPAQTTTTEPLDRWGDTKAERALSVGEWIMGVTYIQCSRKRVQPPKKSVKSHVFGFSKKRKKNVTS